MKINVLHIVGGSTNNGSFKGANILHQALLDLNINSILVNDSQKSVKEKAEDPKLKNITFIEFSFFEKILKNLYIVLEKILKSLILHSPRETFTFGLLGSDITKIKGYEEADVIHIHWLGEGFIKVSSLSKINKPVIWTMRDMWAFTGGSHYTMDFQKYETSKLSKILKNFKKNIYKKNFRFIAISDWLKNKARESSVLKNFNVDRIYNNIDLKNLKSISKEKGRLSLNIHTKKKIILYGATNPQSKRKGWNLFVETLKNLDKSKYYLLIFGSFWSQKILDEIGLEYKSLGFIDDIKILNSAYSSSDIFVASSIQDGWPKTFAEAMYCGNPVVCFANTSISEIIDHKKNGYIVKDFDPNQLKDGIDWMCKEIENNNFDKNEAKLKISEYAANEIAKKYVQLYKNILNEN